MIKGSKGEHHLHVRRRNSYNAIHRKDLVDETKGPYCSLGNNWFVKKIDGKNKYYYFTSGTVYQEMSPACFETTVSRSKQPQIQIMKSHLHNFEKENIYGQ